MLQKQTGAAAFEKGCVPMNCPVCGFENAEKSDACTSCGSSMTELAGQKDVFIWSELPTMPKFHTPEGDNSTELTSPHRRRLSRHTKRILWQTAIFALEACILVGAVTGVFLWREQQFKPPVNADNIVYSSDDIVMMLVQQKEKWLLKKPDNGYNACCFLDLDFDGSPELMSISYNADNGVTQLDAYRVRSCTLEKIPVDQWKPEETAIFYDAMQQQMSLHYAPDTKEMLYLCSDTKILSESEGEAYTGSFYLQESRIFQKYYLSHAVSNGMYSYYVYDEGEDGTSLASAVSRQEYRRQQEALLDGLVNLHLRYEWVTSKNDLKKLSDHKLAALLLRSYSSFSYDTSGLALQ